MLRRLVVFGLGNPGARYANTRHNLGFRVVDRIAAGRGVAARDATRSYTAARFVVGPASVELVKPKTFMNLSGVGVRDYGRDRDVAVEEILVVVDDIALPLGRLRLRRSGSDGGHNGLKSVAAALGTTAFSRLRLGIGPVPAGVDPAEFVLDPFAEEEEGTVEAMVDRAARCVDTIVREDLDRAMGAFNAPEGESGTGGEGQGPARAGKPVDPAGEV